MSQNDENYKIVLSALRDSNIAEFQNIMSDQDILKTLLSRPTTGVKKEDEINSLPEAKKAQALSAVSDVLQAITSEALTISEMLTMLYSNYDEDVIFTLGDFIKIVHSEYKFKASVKDASGQRKPEEFMLSETPFPISYFSALPDPVTPYPASGAKSKKAINRYFKKNNNFLHSSDYGLIKTSAVLDYYADDLMGLSNVNLVTSLQDASRNKKTLISPVKNNVGIFNIDTIVNKKVQVNKKPNQGSTQTPTAVSGEIEHVNKVNQDKEILATKEDPSLAYILVDSADLRIGTRNTLELSTFFNMLSTIELSKCQPYFNAVFLLPGEVENTASGNVFKTASITQFFDGTPFSEEFTSDVYKTLEASFVRTQKTRDDKIDVRAVNTNLSAFTMPQTINRFDEVFVGHDENINFFENDKFRRATAIHDYTRPFLTIKSFDIDVAPTQGLMSFKTGKLSLILHDRTRMTDIAPFIKPDLFGSFGAEIAIEYGWSHVDSGGKINYLGDFLNNSRVTEKYIITNSSFSMDNNGQVNIDLSIAMRGPIDIKNVVIKSDPPGEVSRQAVKTALDNFKKAIQKLPDLNINLDSLYQKVINDLQDVTGSADQLKNASFTEFSSLSSAYHRIGLLKRLKKVKDLTTLQNFLDGNNEGIFVSKKNVKILQSEQIVVQNTDKNAISTISLNANQLSTFKRAFRVQYRRLIGQIGNVLSAKRTLKNKTVEMLNKIVGGLDVVDPFYNKEWLKQYHKIVLGNANIDQDGINVIGIGGSDSTSYVTLGSFITGLIGTHMSCTGKFDEIQIVSYTANEFCGLMSNLNVSSFLLPRVALSTFLEDLFKDGTSITIESLITQVIERFISTRLQICYGLGEFYTRDAANNTIVKNKTYRKDSKKLQKVINNKLTTIYTALATGKSKPFTDEEFADFEDVKFVMPKVKFTFDTITSKKSGYQRTICRISIFDQNDNPFGSVHSIMKKVYDEDGVVGIAAKLNRLRAAYKVGTLESSIKKINKTKSELAKLKKNKNTAKDIKAKNKEIARLSKEISKIQQELVRVDFYKRQGRIIDKLINEGKLIKVNDSSYKIVDNFQLSTIKNSLKNIMPSITYGSQNSAVIDASVTTVNEAKLNTVYLTRSDRNSGGKTQETKVQFQKDLPLRVLPSQASVTIFGCPFVNFAQYLFLDFETGTTVDNAYAVTGIKHSISPGKFTTSLTLTYGDVYGKYEGASSSIQRAINEQEKSKKAIGTDAIIDQTSNKIVKIVDFQKEKPGEYKDSTSKIEGNNKVVKIASEDGKNFTYSFNLIGFVYDQDFISINKKRKNFDYDFDLFQFINYDKNKNKKIEVSLDLEKIDKKANDELIKNINKKSSVFNIETLLKLLEDELKRNITIKPYYASDRKLLRSHKFFKFDKGKSYRDSAENIIKNVQQDLRLEYDLFYSDRKSLEDTLNKSKISLLYIEKDNNYQAIFDELNKIFNKFETNKKSPYRKLSITLTSEGISIKQQLKGKPETENIIKISSYMTNGEVLHKEDFDLIDLDVT